ncbi:MAG TPA: nuclear transport factor 2 family protein [Thermoanaerobaculia bacterium]|nr:nuclear transport factor 2 family protein [Thermoanaerobaculia bacterium]
MKKAILSLCLAVIAIALPVAAANFASDEQALRKLDREMAIATYMADADWFRVHLSDDYVRITSTGELQTKAELVESMKKRGPYIEPYEASDAHIRAHGSTAIITGRIVQRYKEANERVIAELRYNDVWIKTDEGWLNISGQVSPISIKRERVK